MNGQSGSAQWAAANAATGPAVSGAQLNAARVEHGNLQSANDDIHLGLYYRAAKRVMDVLGSIVLALTFLPIMLFVFFVLKRGGGSVFFGHTRVGRNGVRFKVYKFRTMIPDADAVLRELLASDPSLRAEWERDHKLKNDPRVTRLGCFLRKTSLDELPQLWNVLTGEMSLVGPRPIVAEELVRYGRAARYYLATKPGLTGLWQVTGRNDTDYRRRVALDRHYAQTANLFTDLLVLLKTVGVVLFRRGAY